MGSQYEFGPSLSDDVELTFGHGALGHAPHEWTDDTSMAIPILDALAVGMESGIEMPLEDSRTRESIVARWIEWSKDAKDVGIQTREVLGRIPQQFAEADVLAAAQAVHDARGRSGGNGALMRTGPLAFGYFEDPAALADMAHRPGPIPATSVTATAG